MNKEKAKELLNTVMYGDNPDEKQIAFDQLTNLFDVLLPEQ